MSASSMRVPAMLVLRPEALRPGGAFRVIRLEGDKYALDTREGA